MESSSVLFGGIIMADKYRIGEVAKLLGVTTSAIRFYEKNGNGQAGKKRGKRLSLLSRKRCEKVAEHFVPSQYGDESVRH